MNEEYNPVAAEGVAIVTPQSQPFPDPRITLDVIVDDWFRAIRDQSLSATALQVQLDRHEKIGEDKFGELAETEGYRQAAQWLSSSGWQKTHDELKAKLETALKEPDTMLFVQSVLLRAFTATEFPVKDTIVLSTEVTNKDGIYIVDTKKSSKGARSVASNNSPRGKKDSPSNSANKKENAEKEFDPEALLTDENLTVVFHLEKGGKMVPTTGGIWFWKVGDFLETYSVQSGMYSDLISEVPEAKLIDTSPQNPLYRIGYAMIRNPWSLLKEPLESILIYYGMKVVVTISRCSNRNCKAVLVDRKDMPPFQSLFPLPPDHLAVAEQKRFSFQRAQELHDPKVCNGRPTQIVGPK